MATILRKTICVLAPLSSISHFFLNIFSPSYSFDPFLLHAAIALVIASFFLVLLPVVAYNFLYVFAFSAKEREGKEEDAKEAEKAKKEYVREFLFCILPSIALIIASLVI